jgi:nucleoside 2-deoxyribosyltransferase
MYLAGAIRDSRPEDIEWRERVIEALQGLPVRILNPLGGKSYEDGKWTVSGVESTASFIFNHDKWCVEQSDIVLFNFQALSQGYANIGTLVEFGMAVGMPGKLIYSVVDPSYTGHENVQMYKLHPFLAQPSSYVFATMGEAIEFLRRHLKVLSGRAPSFAAYRTAEAGVQSR